MATSPMYCPSPSYLSARIVKFASFITSNFVALLVTGIVIFRVTISVELSNDAVIP